MSTVSNNNNSSQNVKGSPNITSTWKSSGNESQNSSSTLKMNHVDHIGNNSSVEVGSYSSSQKENTSSNQGNLSPSIDGNKISPKVTEFSSLSSFESGTGNGFTHLARSKFKIITKLKSAMAKVNKAHANDSSVQVGSLSTSSSGNRSSGSSMINGVISKLKVGSVSLSPKESSFNTGSSSMPVVLLDITEPGYSTMHDKTTVDIEQDMPKSEGFDLHDTKDFEVSSKTDSDKLEWKKKRREKKRVYASKLCTVCC
jgi:hypothetical protein